MHNYLNLRQAPTKAPKQPLTAPMYYVVPKAQALAMQGYKANKTRNITVLAVCNSYERAALHVRKVFVPGIGPMVIDAIVQL